MTMALGWDDVAIRLLLTLLAGAIIGFNREERGQQAGLRTTILVSLAASVSMILANLLLPTTGRPADSFVSLDVMRIPLGILTGMGFIGAGAILRRGDVIHGVTTAATLWLVTVIGLCLGAGLIGLGLATLGLATGVLWVLKWIEGGFRQERRARLSVRADANSPSERELREMLLRAGYRIATWEVTFKERQDVRLCVLRCELHWQSRPDDLEVPRVVEQIKQLPGVQALQWSA